MATESMRAVVITGFGGPEVLAHRDVPKPVPAVDEVLIRVRAFGLNHAEIHMRKGEWDEWNPISGIECVGTIEPHPSPSATLAARQFPPGRKVAAVMGGMGRTRPGSYGEFVTVPASNVIPLEDDGDDFLRDIDDNGKNDGTAQQLSWAQLAALPETYCTAWTCLFSVLGLTRGETLLIRGATSALGQAAVRLAVDAGAVVTATTRRPERFAELLRGMGAVSVVKEGESGLLLSPDSDPAATNKTEANKKFDKTLNLIGNRALLESLRLTRPGGRALQAGWLGGLEPLGAFDPMLQMEPGVHFSLFHSKVLGSPEFPLADVPLRDIVRRIAKRGNEAKEEEGENVIAVAPACVFSYEDIVEAHRALDAQDVGGKIVVVH